MSIRDRVEDAEFLWKSNRREGAWILAMVATAATARKRYPRPMPDNESFKTYVHDVILTIITGKPQPAQVPAGSVSMTFGDRPFEDVLYHDYRCAWIHEGALTDASLSDSKIADNYIIETLAIGQNTQIPNNWVLNLLQAIRLSPENDEEFKK